MAATGSSVVTVASLALARGTTVKVYLELLRAEGHHPHRFQGSGPWMVNLRAKKNRRANSAAASRSKQAKKRLYGLV